MLENRMLIDEEWGELEYGVPAPRKDDPWEIERMMEVEDDEREFEHIREMP